MVIIVTGVCPQCRGNRAFLVDIRGMFFNCDCGATIDLQTIPGKGNTRVYEVKPRQRTEKGEDWHHGKDYFQLSRMPTAKSP